ncbi:melatonin receptor type 1A-like [Ylistrum balloti]|uniref:melatonin receptor type 1A-like n=1 Tax=Ylistrum balloti TaxID=509963 RepID=UPI002905897C|nr:melatonin receptor type 1A-like [Ylistrum balloti]
MDVPILYNFTKTTMNNLADTNTTNLTDVGPVGPSQTALHIGGIIMLLALLSGLFGNFLVMIIIFTKRDLSNIINIFIISLCINDIINLGLNNNMVLLSYFLGKFPTGMLGCELATHFSVLLMGSSLWHTGLIAIHRLIVVVFNNFYKIISKKAYTIFVLVFARVVPLLFLCQPSLGNMAYYEPKLLRCIVKKNYGPFTLLVSVFLMMLPSVILIVCYIAIFIKVHQSSRASRVSRQREWLKREIKITKMFGMVFLLILIGYLPYGIVRAMDKRLEWHADFYVAITVFFAIANSSNPIVYGIMDKQIRQQCLQALHIKTSKEDSKNGNITSSSRMSHNGYKDKEEVNEVVPLNNSKTDVVPLNNSKPEVIPLNNTKTDSEKEVKS